MAVNTWVCVSKYFDKYIYPCISPVLFPLSLTLYFNFKWLSYQTFSKRQWTKNRSCIIFSVKSSQAVNLAGDFKFGQSVKKILNIFCPVILRNNRGLFLMKGKICEDFPIMFGMVSHQFWEVWKSFWKYFSWVWSTFILNTWKVFNK